MSEEKYRSSESYSLNQGDVIVSRAGTVGKMGVVRTISERSLISTNLIRIRFGDLLLPEYFVSLMTYCKGRVGRLRVGPDGAFTHMNVGVLDSIEFPYPPVQLQEKYLAIRKRVLGLLDEKTASMRGLTRTLDSLSQKAFVGWIVSARTLNVAIKEYRQYGNIRLPDNHAPSALIGQQPVAQFPALIHRSDTTGAHT